MVCCDLALQKIVRIPYLHEANEREASEAVKTYKGFNYRRNLRTMLPCVVVSFEGRARWVFFLVDNSGAPLT
jgi:hypothetical protein